MARPRKRPSEAAPVLPERGKILALDISSVCVGWSVWDDGRLTDYGRLLLPGDGHGERLASFGLWLRASHLDTLDAVVYETPYFGRQRHTYGVLQLYIGVLHAEHWDLRQLEIPDDCRIQSHVVKKTLGLKKLGSHEARKKQMVQEINKRFGLKLKYKANDRAKAISEDDTADAIALGLVYHLLHA